MRGGLGVCVIVGSAMIGAIATIVTKSQPGSVLGLSVLAGTVAAALTVQPRTGRLIFPVPALSYLVAALGAGVVYDRSADKTQIAVGAAQWIASGFFVMVLATLLAIALTTVRWFMWRRDQPGPVPPDWPDPGRTAPRSQPGPARPPGTPPGTQPTQWRPGSQGTGGQDQRSRPYPEPGPSRGPDQRPEPRPGSGPRVLCKSSSYAKNPLWLRAAHLHRSLAQAPKACTCESVLHNAPYNFSSGA